MIEWILLPLLVVMAVVIVMTDDLKRAVIYFGMLSLICSILFLLYGAPDLAIAEAVIGSGLSTILYLVAMKKAEHFTICVITDGGQEKDSGAKEAGPAIKEIRHMLAHRDIDCEVRYVEMELQSLIRRHEADLIVNMDNGTIVLTGISQSCNLDSIEQLMGDKDEFSCCKLERIKSSREGR